MSPFPFVPTDADLVAGALRHRPSSFEALIDRYQRRALAIARSCGIPRDNLDDVLQEAFLQAFRGLRSLRTPAAFGGWFLRIVRNVALKSQRRQQLEHRTRASRGTVEMDAFEDPKIASTGAPLEQRELKDELWSAVDALPAGVREAIFLYYYEGRSIRAVATALEVTNSAAKSRLQRGREILRERLWHRLQEALDNESPNRKDLQRKSRHLALLVIAAAPAAATAATTTPKVEHTDSPSGPGPASSSDGPAATLEAAGVTATKTVTGVILMSSKQLLVGIGVLTACALGGWFAFEATHQEDSPTHTAQSPSATSSTSDDATERTTTSTPRPVSATPTPPATPAIAGGIAGGIEGRVAFHDDGVAVAGARVEAIRSDTGDIAADARTDESGHFRLALANGRYFLFASKDTWTTRAKKLADPIDVKPGQFVRADRSLVAGGPLSGVVQIESTQEPVPGADVTYRGVLQRRTDDQGRFRFEALPDGPGTTRATAPGYTEERLHCQITVGGEAFARFELNLAGTLTGTVTDADGHVVAGAVVRGLRFGTRTDAEGRYELDTVPLGATAVTVTASRNGLYASSTEFEGFAEGHRQATLDFRLTRGVTLSGTLQDRAGAPITDADLKLSGSLVFSSKHRTDANGRFRIDGASDHVFFLSATAAGFAPVSLDLRDLPQKDWSDLQLTLEPEHTVSGIVVDAEGRPIAGAAVYVETSPRRATGAITTKSDAEGRFRVEGLPKDLGEIGALKGGYTDLRNMDVEAGQTDVRLVLHRRGILHAVVEDAATGEPIYPVRVKILHPTERRYRAHNDARKHVGGLIADLGRRGLHFNNPDGSFAITDGIASDYYYKLLVSAEGYSEATVEGAMPWTADKEQEPLKIPLDRGSVLRGRVVDALHGDALSGVSVVHFVERGRGVQEPWNSRRRRSDQTPRRASTDENGEFVLDGIPSESAVLLLSHEGYSRTSLYRILPSAGVQVFELTRGATIHGQISTESGTVIPGAKVQLTVNGVRFPDEVSDKKGTFQFSELPVGQAEILVQRKGYLRQFARVATHAGEEVQRDFVVGEASLVGRVTLQSSAVERSSVMVENTAQRDEREWVLTDAEGMFRMDGLSPGRYKVVANRPRNGGLFYQGAQRYVDVGQGEYRCDLALTPLTEIELYVIDRRNGQEVSEGRLEIFKHMPEAFEGIPIEVPMGGWLPQGSAQIRRGMTVTLDGAGKYALRAQSNDGLGQGTYGPFDYDPEDPPPSIRIELGGTGELSLKILGPDGKPVGAPAVLRASEHSWWQIPGHAAGVGALRFGNLSAGRYELRIDQSPFGRVRKTLEIGDSHEELTVRLQEVPWLRIELEAPRTRKHFMVQLVIEQGKDPGWPTQTRDGLPAMRFRVVGHPLRAPLAPGNYRIRAELLDGFDLEARTLRSRTFAVAAPESGEVAATVDLNDT